MGGVVGTTCSGWAIVPGCLVLNMPKPMRSNRRCLKKLPDEVEAIRQAHPSSQVELWRSDEHRIGLKPILRRVWALKGTAVRAIVSPHYQWMYVCLCLCASRKWTQQLAAPADRQRRSLFASAGDLCPRGRGGS